MSELTLALLLGTGFLLLYYAAGWVYGDLALRRKPWLR